MNLATLVSSLVLAASTATAGLLVAPLPAFPASPHGNPVGPICLGTCGNSTGNQTAPPPGNQTVLPPLPTLNLTGNGNGTSPPPQDNGTAPPPSGNQTAPPATCGVDIEDMRDVEGPSHHAWAWQVGTGTRSLNVSMQARGTWLPLAGGLHARLTDGDGNLVAATDGNASLMLSGYTALGYAGAAPGLSRGTWHLSVDADGILGEVWVQVHSGC